MNSRLYGDFAGHIRYVRCEKCAHLYVLAALMLLIKSYLLAGVFFSASSLTFMSVYEREKDVTGCALLACVYHYYLLSSRANLKLKVRYTFFPRLDSLRRDECAFQSRASAGRLCLSLICTGWMLSAC